MATAGPSISESILEKHIQDLIKLSSRYPKPEERHQELERFFSIHAPSPLMRAELTKKLLQHSYHELPETLQQILEILCNEIVPTDSIIQSKYHPLRDRSILWLLAQEASSNPKLFLTLFINSQAKIKLEALLDQATEGVCKGNSSLWNLAQAAKKGHQEPFLRVWAKFQKEITLADFLSKAQNDICVLDWIVDWDPDFVTKILGQVPGETLVTLLPERFEPLVCARNLFFEVLKKIKLQALPLSTGYIKMLFEEAEKAQAAGYLNAYYDLAKSLVSFEELEAAHEAYKKIPRTSCHYLQVNALLAEHHFSLACDREQSENSKAFHQREALKYALESDDLNRVRIIRKIAVIITGSEQLGNNFFQQFRSLETKNSLSLIDFYLDAFKNLQRMLEVEKLNEILREQLACSQQKTQTAECTNAALLKKIESIEGALKSLHLANPLLVRVEALERAFDQKMFKDPLVPSAPTLSFSKPSQARSDTAPSPVATPTDPDHRASSQMLNVV